MNYQAFTNDSLTAMYEVIRGALDADDSLKARAKRSGFGSAKRLTGSCRLPIWKWK
jgi:hypothetical protein